MKKYTPIMALLFLSILLTSCVHHLSKTECYNTNWNQVGFSDGSRGRPTRSLKSSIKDCEKFKISVDPSIYQTGYRRGLTQYCKPTYALGLANGQNGNPLSVILKREPICQRNQIPFDTNRYQKGRAKGLISFCTFDRGQSLGANGKGLPSVCPTKTRAQFSQGWEAGRQQFCANTENGFALGKAGKSYPGVCIGNRFLAFRSEFNRGRVVLTRIKNLKTRIQRVKRQINDNVDQFSLQTNLDGSYYLGANKTRQARAALRRIRALTRQRNRLNTQLYQVQSSY